MNSMSLLLTFLANPSSLLTMGAAGLIALVYYFGPEFGLRGTPRLLVVLGLVLIYVGVFVFITLRRRRKKDQAAADLETSMIMEADQSVASAEADQKRVREDARRELVAAIDVLKKSSLADGRGGKAALYVLPWYLVMGSSYSGKSSLIRNSGLQNPGKGPGELRGIGASSNCEWWFTNHAVFLEADRRFTTIAGAKAVEGDWETYLATLSKQRADTALNGVVVTISAPELMQGSTSEQEEMARLLRKRLDTMSTQLRQVFPVYLMITKMDQVQGFGDFFAGLAGLGADQILGATLRADQMQKPNPEKFVGAEFDRIYSNLCRRRQMRLIQSEYEDKREGTFLFPLQFRSVGDNLQRFVQVLCEPNAYGRNPMLRGFYFVSAGGDGEVSDHILHEMSRVLGLPAPKMPVAESGQPFFLRGFFRKVLVPDRDIARPTRGAARRTRLIRRVFQVAALTVLAALLVNLCVSFGSSLILVKQTKDRALLARDAHFVGGRERIPDAAMVLPKLDLLREQLEKLDQAGTGFSQIRWMGMNRGQKVNAKARDMYLERFVDIVARPYATELEHWLLASESSGVEFAEYWRRYQAYRLLFEPTRGDSLLVSGVLQDILAESDPEGNVSPGSDKMLHKHVVFAMSHARELQNVGENRIEMSRRVLSNAESKIRDNWTAVDYYERVISEVNAMGELGLDLSDLNQSSTMLVMRGGSANSVVRGVPGSFTKRGWQEQIKHQLGDVDGFLEQYSWLLPKSVIDKKEALKSELLHYYEKDYVVAWQRFLANVAIKEPIDMQDAETRLATLAADDSPYMQLINLAELNLYLEPDGDDEDEAVREILSYITLSFDALHRFQDDAKLGDDDPDPRGELVNLIKGLAAVLADNSQGGQEQKKAFTFTKAIAAAEGDSEGPIGKVMSFANNRCFHPKVQGQRASKEAFESLLQLPALHTWQAFLRDTEGYLDERWAEEVQRPFVRDLKGKYPFSTSAEIDVAPEVFGEFFGGSGKLQAFIKAYLEPYVESDFSPKQVFGNGLRLAPDAIETLAKGNKLRAAFFKGEDTSPRFEARLKYNQSPPVRNDLWVSTVDFDTGGKKFVLGTGHEKVRTLTWPPVDTDASISVRLIPGDGFASVAKASGVWGLFRLRELAEVQRLSSDALKLTWRKKMTDGAGEIAVSFDLTFKSPAHPFTPGLFDFLCPLKLNQ